jgi:hypothetical protein
MLQVGFRHAPIPSPAQAKGAHALRVSSPPRKRANITG